MGVLFGTMFICDSCGKERFVKQGESADGWTFRDLKILCHYCSAAYEIRRTRESKEVKENE